MWHPAQPQLTCSGVEAAECCGIDGLRRQRSRIEVAQVASGAAHKREGVAVGRVGALVAAGRVIAWPQRRRCNIAIPRVSQWVGAVAICGQGSR